MKGVEAKKIVRNYNRTATVLMEFEIRYHRAWIDQIEAVKSGTYSCDVYQNHSQYKA